MPEAQANLGLLYDSGQGVEPDPASAVEWYQKAAEQGHPLGQGALGLALFNGVGAPKDIVQGYMWTMLAADQQDWTAMSNLPVMSSRMTVAQRSSARKKASEFRASERGPRRSELRGLRSDAQHKERGRRRRSVNRPERNF